MKLSACALVVVALTFVGCEQTTTPSNSNTTTTHTTMKPVEPDNTAINERDRDRNATTPPSQNENQKDIDVTANIRKRVVSSKMSVNAQNVKIMTADGKVTLRGPVNSDDEKKKIGDIAVDVAGKDKVDNQLEVKP